MRFWLDPWLDRPMEVSNPPRINISVNEALNNNVFLDSIAGKAISTGCISSNSASEAFS